MPSSEDSPALAGLTVEEAADAVVATHDVDRDRATAILRSVAEDGVVSREAVTDRLGHVSKVVSTPETRLELADNAHQEVLAAAEEGPGYETVTARLTRYEARLEDIREAVRNLGTRLQTLVDRRDEDALFPLARDIEALNARATQLQQQADKLTADLERFQDWLDDPTVRADRLEEDVDLIEEGLTSLSTAIDAIPSDDGSAEDGRRWFDASLRRRVFELLVADLRFEHAELEDWEAAADTGQTGLTTVGEHIDALEAELDRIAVRLEELGRPAWTDRFEDRLASAEADLATIDPPVAWGPVQEILDRHRPEELQAQPA